MSGNYTQRAEVAFADKLLRAEAAVECGINLVVELPFPYSSASADFFASAGVAIAEGLSVVDVLSFGSECGDSSTLKKIAENMLSDKFRREIASESKVSENIGYPMLIERVYRKCFGVEESFTTPNNILALEYIKSLTKFNSKIEPHTIKRVGENYKSNTITNESFPSASAIRMNFAEKGKSALEFLPNSAKNIYLRNYGTSSFPCDTDKLSTAFLSFFRLNSTPAKPIHDAEGGLYNRLSKLSFRANSITSLTQLATTKKYTSARIRRAALFSFFGVTSSDVREMPRYTQVLAMDAVGMRLLKEIKKKGTVKVITKPSVTRGLDSVATRQKALSDSADSIFQLTKPTDADGTYHITFTPYVKD